MMPELNHKKLPRAVRHRILPAAATPHLLLLALPCHAEEKKSLTILHYAVSTNSEMQGFLIYLKGPHKPKISFVCGVPLNKEAPHFLVCENCLMEHSMEVNDLFPA